MNHYFVFGFSSSNRGSRKGSSLTADSYLQLLSVLQNAVMNKFGHLGELLCIVIQMCRLTKACTE